MRIENENRCRVPAGPPSLPTVVLRQLRRGLAVARRPDNASVGGKAVTYAVSLVSFS